jgi:hypothetical protein
MVMSISQAQRLIDELQFPPEEYMLLGALADEPRRADKVEGMWVFEDGTEYPRSVVGCLVMMGLIMRIEVRPEPLGSILYHEFYITESGRAALARWEN